MGPPGFDGPLILIVDSNSVCYSGTSTNATVQPSHWLSTELISFNVSNEFEEAELERKAREKKRTEDIRRGWKQAKHNARKPWEK